MSIGSTLKSAASSTGALLKNIGSSSIGQKALSAGKAIGKSALQTAGIVEKGIIEIIDFSEREIKEENAQKPGGGGINGVNIGGFDTDLVQNYGNVMKEAGKKALAAGANLAEGEKEGFKISGSNVKNLKFEVPFNPSELSISGYGGEQVAIQSFSADGKGRGSNSVGSVNSHIEMNIPLIFDKLNNKEAFYNENFSLGTTSVARGIAKIGKDAIMKTAGKNDIYSVQPEVEAFTHIIRSNTKRLIMFTWGDMSYQGVLIGVSTEYNMFNINGEPCRAKVTLRIVLLDATDYSSTVKIWTGKYKKNLNFNAGSSAISHLANLTDLD